LTKKLEYLHKNFIFKLYSQFRYPNLFWKQDDVLMLRSDLDIYAKFLGLGLYPKNLPKEIHGFLAFHHEFFMKYQEIEKLAMKQMGIENLIDLTRELLQDYIGLKPNLVSSSYDPKAKQRYNDTAQIIIKENSQLVSETKEYLQKTRESAARIFSKLEDFLKSNNLRLEPESIT
jgi:hypothetical protein